MMRFASLFWRMASEKSGKSHERKAANHFREKWRIASEKDGDSPLFSVVICRFLSCDLPLFSDAIRQSFLVKGIGEERQIIREKSGKSHQRKMANFIGDRW
jgi:hypothetical protein